MIFDRYAEMLAERGIHPFQRIPWEDPETGLVNPRVLGEPLPLRWRVSPDEWERLNDWCRSAYGWTVPSTGGGMLFGWPIEPDDTLPPRSVILAVSAA
jgi:hypothetical protein